MKRDGFPELTEIDIKRAALWQPFSRCNLIRISEAGCEFFSQLDAIHMAVVLDVNVLMYRKENDEIYVIFAAGILWGCMVVRFVYL
ncbi:hypothetical protein SAMN03159341_101557 [Paenibacillus sp. 1_12]|nr:hypothetical protein SAMN03159341_101557 [Paenibacillus sp. 1_12]